MKKLIGLISFLALFAGLIAQEGIVLNDSWQYYTGKSSDTITGTAALYKVIRLKNIDYWYNLKITEDIDTVTGSDGNMYCMLYGSNSGTIADTTRIGSIVTYAGSADTLFTVSNSTISTNAETVAQHTRTTATFTVNDTTASYVMSDTLAAFMLYADSVGSGDSIRYAYPQRTGALTVAQQAMARTVPAQVETVAAQTITNTITAGGLNWQYLIVYYKGKGASVRNELQKLYISVTKIPGY